MLPVVVVGWLVGWLVGGGGVMEGWRCEGGGGAAAAVVVEGWMTDQALRNNYLHKIPSPFSFGEGQRGGEKRDGGGWRVGGGVGRRGWYVEKSPVFLLGLPYEGLRT